MHIAAPERLITLTTDFGTRDGYAGAMKGVIRALLPEIPVEDITHEVPAGDIRAGAWALRTSAAFYPRGTVHVAVIDPGVGTSRRALVAVVNGQFFIGPDNGVFSWIFSEAKRVEVWTLSDASWRPARVSNTFHGRDLFAHAAARLVSEGEITALCGEKLEPVVAPWARWVEAPGEGEVVHVDRFGNVITNVLLPEDAVGGGWDVFVPERDVHVDRLRRTYGDVGKGEPLALIGSHNFLEIAVRQGSAAETLGLRVGDEVRVNLNPSVE